MAGTQPAWGPTTIAYVGPKGLWTANPDGSDPVEVASTGNDPAWSADGRLAYRLGLTSSTVVVGSTQVPPDVYTVRTDGTDPVQLTEN